MTSLGNHVGVVVSILTIVFFLLIGAVGVIYRLLMNKLDKIEEKAEKFINFYTECHGSLPEKYVAICELSDFRKEFRELWTAFTIQRRQDWAEMWAAFNKHGHEEKSGEVIRRG